MIDEARTPLIISGKGEESSKLYEMADYFVARLKKAGLLHHRRQGICRISSTATTSSTKKERTVSLTQKGIAKAEEFFGVENLADVENATLNHHINQAMKARGVMQRDIDYVVKDGRSSSSMNSPAV